MQIEMNMGTDNKFTAHSWWATNPSFVLHTLQSQLYAAAGIWPELAEYEIKKTGAAMVQEGKTDEIPS